MKSAFFNRVAEQARLRSLLRRDESTLAVIYGRRRCGKSTLLQHVIDRTDIYFLADLQEVPLQILSFAKAVDPVFPGFSNAVYPSWDILFQSLVARGSRKINLVIDEFPYLVQSSPALPSIIQRLIDAPGGCPITWVLCGSSQRMMQGLVLDQAAPLYGRAREILKIRPLAVGWIQDALGMDADKSIEAYAVWGGVPRYWELAQDYDSTRVAFLDLVADRNGVLHEEPGHLLQDDMRSSVQAFSLLSLIGGGCHRLSEIAARLQKPAGSLTRPLAQLIELGYVQRDYPFGENPRSTKRTLYRLSDPFLRFYYRFVLPNKSLLEIGQTDAVMACIDADFLSHVGGVWEDLARTSVPFLAVGGTRWGVASRWWGADTTGQPVELDIVALSLDRKSILLGEVKWSVDDLHRQVRRLQDLSSRLPFIAGRRVVLALWSRGQGGVVEGAAHYTPCDVLDALK
jgi:uncharacterized protein